MTANQKIIDFFPHCDMLNTHQSVEGRDFMKIRKAFLSLALCLLLVMPGIPAAFAEAAEEPDFCVTGTVVEIEKYGHLRLSVSIEEFEHAGFRLGDIVTVTTENYSGDMPYFNGYYVEKGEYLVLAYPGKEYIAVCINYGNFSEINGVKVGDVVTITMKEAAGALAEQEISNLVYSTDRSDYSLDMVFSNFRPIVMGDLAEGVLYRSASPVNNFYNRASYANELAEIAKIRSVMNLADTDDEILSYFEEDSFCSDYYRKLYEDGQVIALGMPITFDTPEFAQGIVRGLTFLSEQEPPYLVHCTEGKDRAGFAAMVLEAITGASSEEIIADYMKSYANYYDIEPGTEKYNMIIEKNISHMLPIIAGTDDFTGVDLAAATEAYLIDNGMAPEALNALKGKLTGACS